MVLYFDCFSGISGNMAIGAMLELGVDFEQLKAQLSKLNITEEYELIMKKTEKCGIGGTYFNVKLSHEHSHHHEHEYAHHHAHRGLTDIYKIIDESKLSDEVKNLSKKIFQFVADAESKIHNKSFDELHFHEVGAVDSIIDIVGNAICLDILKPEKILASPTAVGSGFVDCAHGKMPVPAPATAEIIKQAKIPVYAGQVKSELTTPTGAAILAATVSEFCELPNTKIDNIAYGAGTRNFDVPNLLRIYSLAKSSDEAVLKKKA
ncbi:MAG: TIGR00299 family protein [Treponema sp.]|nr:MAG: TIGR00299 family protein [Treponema sp.]